MLPPSLYCLVVQQVANLVSLLRMDGGGGEELEALVDAMQLVLEEGTLMLRILAKVENELDRTRKQMQLSVAKDELEKGVKERFDIVCILRIYDTCDLGCLRLVTHMVYKNAL